ncbi:MAG TPA: exo-alpha-sialidase, partial [candidate division Zixibacteria bacterium]|nr:exo-alpha-sialidase [candidate division Zixibacteria bacterium]
MKILRILGVLFAFFMLMGVSVSTRSIAPPPRRIDTLEDELALTRDYLGDIADAVGSAFGLDEVPEWIRDEALRSVTNTSYSQSTKAVRAWRQRAEMIGSTDERVGRVAHRPDPRPPEEPGETMSANNWNIDRRVNTDASGQQFHPAVAMGSDGTIYVAWAHYMDASNSWIYFSKSSDDGVTWTSPRAVRTSGINNRPRIAAHGTGSTADVYITYTFWRNPSNYVYDIYCAVSNNGGTSFGTYAIRASGDYDDMSAVVTDDAGYVYIALVHGWVSGGGCDASTADTRILLYRSTNRGSSWTGAYSLADYGGQRDNILPSLAVHGGGTTATLHFAWTRDVTTTGGNYDVYYKKILNAGGTPVIPSGYITIANSSGQEYVIPGGIGVGPDGNPHIAYMYSTPSTGYGDIYYRRSIDGGNSFLAAVPISNRITEESDPVIAIDARNNPTIAWRDSRHGNYDIYMTYSNNKGVSWVEAFRVNQDVTTANQYWPGLAMWASGWQRKVAAVWWDERYDDGDIYYNGNHMVGVSLDVSYVPTPPLWPLPRFTYRAFDIPRDTMFTSAVVYDIWFDPEYSNDPRLDELWAGSSSSERWAVDNPGGWTWLAGNYWTPPSTGGAFDCPYYRQFRVLFKAIRGNPPACSHTVPNIHLDYESFGNNVHTTINDAIVCTAWVDAFTSYDMDGWFGLSPTQRWATVSPDTIGTISAPRTVQPHYF